MEKKAEIHNYQCFKICFLLKYIMDGSVKKIGIEIPPGVHRDLGEFIPDCEEVN